MACCEGINFLRILILYHANYDALEGKVYHVRHWLSKLHAWACYLRSWQSCKMTLVKMRKRAGPWLLSGRIIASRILLRQKSFGITKIRLLNRKLRVMSSKINNALNICDGFLQGCKVVLMYIIIDHQFKSVKVSW